MQFKILLVLTIAATSCLSVSGEVCKVVGTYHSFLHWSYLQLECLAGSGHTTQRCVQGRWNIGDLIDIEIVLRGC